MIPETELQHPRFPTPASSEPKAVRIFSLTDFGLREKGEGEGNGSLCPRGSSASSCLLLRQTNSTPNPPG